MASGQLGLDALTPELRADLHPQVLAAGEGDFDTESGDLHDLRPHRTEAEVH
ncbi:MAG TPA: hypothetical protein VI409_05000 [Gaiellaceae bacterium]|nr:hypothetical protein [Gaiellaceae bacterium]